MPVNRPACPCDRPIEAHQEVSWLLQACIAADLDCIDVGSQYCGQAPGRPLCRTSNHQQVTKADLHPKKLHLCPASCRAEALRHQQGALHGLCTGHLSMPGSTWSVQVHKTPLHAPRSTRCLQERSQYQQCQAQAAAFRAGFRRKLAL